VAVSDLSFLDDNAPSDLKNWKVDPAEQAGREAARLSLLQDEKTQYPDAAAAIDQEIKNNRPIRPKGAALDTSFLDEPKVTPKQLDASFLDEPDESLMQKVVSHIPGAGLADKIGTAIGNFAGAVRTDPINALSDTVHQGLAGAPGFVIGAAEKAAGIIGDPMGIATKQDEFGVPTTPIADKVTQFIEDTMSKGEQGISPAERQKANPEGWKAVEGLFASPATGVGEELVRDSFTKGTKFEPHLRHLGEELTGLVFAGSMVHGLSSKAAAKPRVDGVGAETPIEHPSTSSIPGSDLPTVIQKLGESMDQDVVGRPRFQVPEGMDRTQALEQQFDALDATRDRLDTQENGELDHTFHENVSNALDLLADVEQHSPEYRDVVEVARAYRRLSAQLGLEFTPFVDKSHLSPDAAGTYFGNMDVASIGGEAGKKIGSRVRNLIHEATHSITAQLIDRYQNAMETGDHAWFKESPRRGEVFQRVADFDQVYKDAKEAYRKENGFDPQERVAKIEQLSQTPGVDMQAHLDDAKWHRGEGYGWRDLHEFAAEIMSDPKFREGLVKLKRPSDLSSKSAGNPRRVYGFWEPVKRAFVKMLSVGAGYKGTFLETAVEHVTGLLDSTTAAERTHLTGDSPTARGAKRTAEIEHSVARRQAHPLESLVGDLAHSLSYELREAGGDYNMFRTQAGLLIDHPMWEDFLDHFGPHLWDNSDQFIRAHYNEDRYSHLSKTERRWVMEVGPLEDFMNRHGVGRDGALLTPLVAADDVTTAGKHLLTSRGVAQHAAMGDGLGNAVVKWVHDQGDHYKNMASMLYHKTIDSFQDFNNLPYKDRKGFMNSYAAMDRMSFRDKLRAAGLQWATDDMLRQHGMDDAMIKAYHGVTKGLDIVHNLLDQVNVLTTGEHLERIPGYMPHVFDGAYKVFVKGIEKSGKEYIERVKGFDNRKQALAFVKELESGAWDVADTGKQLRAEMNTQTRQPFWVHKFEDMQSSLAATMNEHLRAYQNELKLDPKTKASLERLEMRSATGFTKHLLDRSDVKGYRGEMGAVEGVSPGSYMDNTKVFRIFQDYAKAATEHYKNVLFTERVTSRLLGEMPDDMSGRRYYGALFKDTPHLADHLWEYSYNFTGENLNHLYKVIDGPLQKVLLYFGKDPTSYRTLARELRNLFSQMTLRLNVKNKVANMTQPALVVSMLDFVSSDLNSKGRKVMSGAEALSRAMGDALVKDSDMHAAIKWAKDQHILDPQLDLEIRGRKFGKAGDAAHTWTAGKVDPMIEAQGREISFMASYEFFRKAFPNDVATARRAAANVMEMVQVNYDRSSRPLLYQNYGVLGEMISPFAVFRNAWLGNTSLMMRKIAQDPKAYASYRGLVATQIVFFALAGASGMIGFQEVNWLLKQYNNLFAEANIPTLDEIMQRVHVPDIVAFGSLSAATKKIPGLEDGVDLGGSLGAMGVDDAYSVPMASFLKNWGSVVLAGARQVGHAVLPDAVRGNTNNDWYASLRAVAPTAPVIKSAAEKLMKGEGSPDVAWKSNGQDALVERSAASQRAFDIFGSASIEERKRALAERSVSRQAKREQDNLKVYVQAAADTMDQKPSGYTYDQAMQKALQTPGVTIEKFRQMVTDEYAKRRVTVKARDAGTDTLEGAQRRYWRGVMGY
jgi:hypothetical protein